ncbi:copper chaperone [Pseudonocardia saturnea]
MALADQERRRVRAPLLTVCACAWFVLLLGPGVHAGHAHGSPASRAAGWLLMLAAMMSPLLVGPVRHVRDRSFARRRARAVTLFLAGWTAVWTVAGAGLLAVSGVAGGEPVAAWAAVVVAVGWQASPAKQRSLNRVHAHPELPAFDRAADVGALRFGVAHAVWCVGTCWALMLLTLLVPYGQLAVMAAVTLWLAAERLDPPSPVRWRLRGPRAAARVAAAQAAAWTARQRGVPASRRGSTQPGRTKWQV